MISSPSDYRFVDFSGGTMPTGQVTGDIMPVRQDPLQLRGEDITFLAEAAIERLTCWHGAVGAVTSTFSATHANFVPQGNLSAAQMGNLRSLYSELFAQDMSNIPVDYADSRIGNCFAGWLASDLTDTFLESYHDGAPQYAPMDLWNTAVLPHLVSSSMPVSPIAASDPLAAGAFSGGAGFFDLVHTTFSRPLIYAANDEWNVVHRNAVLCDWGTVPSGAQTNTSNVIEFVDYFSSGSKVGRRLLGPPVATPLLSVPDTFIGGIRRVWLWGTVWTRWANRNPGDRYYEDSCTGPMLINVTPRVTIRHDNGHWQVLASVDERVAIVQDMFYMLGEPNLPIAAPGQSGVLSWYPGRVLVEGILTDHTRWWTP